MLSTVDRFGQNPIWQSSNLLSTILVNLVFIRIEKILYTIFRRVIGCSYCISSCPLSYIWNRLFLPSILLVESPYLISS